MALAGTAHLPPLVIPAGFPSFPATKANPFQFVIPGYDRESRVSWIPDQVGDDKRLVGDDEWLAGAALDGEKKTNPC